MHIVDTHCHYNMEPLYKDWQTYWQKAKEHGVVGGVIAGTQTETVNRAFVINAKEPNLLVSVGIHPSHAHEITPSQLDEAAKTWVTKKFHAVGETGLDFYRLDRASTDFDQQTNQQKMIFRWHLQFAQTHNMPLILHVRDKAEDYDAYWETLDILEEAYQGTKPFVLHCASGPADYIQKALVMGGYIGFDGNITYPNANEVRDLIKSVPADRLLIETDAPFLAPQTYRGQTCEPWMIVETAKYVEKELELDLNQILENTQRFFNHSFTK
ncbi:MAG: Mg-dependent DNase [Candidatus Pacebacteria bacterium GW2011_GWB1_47_8]|nr:MAG: Mg-dependent DNase [Candidatus Pacebacteria bacterium GW2011_GWA1_46_10]KKU84294.1 MAG: Mg-dependent DNase [Candidatus Pacebacteria bacterium GW2011_GWB1_47_8]HCR81512.1 hypothetical protein [Candidatus Paceibacterota bacterium]